MKIPKFIPLFDIVLVTLEVAEDKEGDLYVPDVAKEKPYHGTILATGPDVKQVKAGDRVLFTKYSGKPVEIDGEKFQYMREPEIVGVIGHDPLTAGLKAA